MIIPISIKMGIIILHVLESSSKIGTRMYGHPQYNLQRRRISETEVNDHHRQTQYTNIPLYR